MLGLILFARVALLAQFALFPGLTGSSASATPPSTTSQASTDNQSDSFKNLTIAKLLTGEKKMTAHDFASAHFWGTLVKEPLRMLGGLAPRIVFGAILFIIFWGIYRALRKILDASMGKAGVDSSIRDMLAHGVKWVVMGTGIVIACNQIGIQIAPLLAGASIVGLAIGLAAQETLANFIAGIVIFWDKPFHVGDCVEIDGACGAVQRVTFRSTRLLTFDGEIVVLPNTVVLAHKLMNHTAHHTGRVNISVGISYSSSIDAARQALLSLVATDDRISQDPEPAVIVNELAESSVRLNFWFWTKAKGGVARLKFEYMEKVKEALDAAGVEIPFPHMNIMLKPRQADQVIEAARELRVAG